MTKPPDERALALRLQSAGCATGISRAGRLLRVDNRSCPRSLSPELLVQILDCQRLRELCLQHIDGFLNAHIGAIASLERLRSLDVAGSDLTDQSLDELDRCRELQVLNIRGTRVTAGHVADVRKRMIGTRIIY